MASDDGTRGREGGTMDGGGGAAADHPKEATASMAAEAQATDHPQGQGGAPGSGEHGAHGHGGHGAHADHGDGSHTSVGFYWMIGGILAVLTAMEVAAFYMELGAIEAPFLLALSAAKFVLVVMFFMHLKFDSSVFTWLFLAGLVLAMFVVSALYVLYQVLPLYGV